MPRIEKALGKMAPPSSLLGLSVVLSDDVLKVGAALVRGKSAELHP